MTRRARRLAKMRLNPHGWRIEELSVAAREHGFAVRPAKGSHVAFTAPNGRHLTVPAHRPVKAIYVKQLIRLIDETGPTPG